jgi:rhodanese-related sulfurtransferase
MTPTIAAADLRDLLATDPETRLLDVRTGGEFETAHIPGSYNVPLDTLAEHADELARFDHPVVLVCQSGGRAGQACERLTAAGGAGLTVLDGGVNAWTAAGGDVKQGRKRWSMERQVRFTAGSIVLGAVLASIAAPKARFLAAGVGGGLMFSAATDTCGMAMVLAKAPWNRTPDVDVSEVIDAMGARSASTHSTGEAA